MMHCSCSVAVDYSLFCDICLTEMLKLSLFFLKKTISVLTLHVTENLNAF